MPDLSFVIEEVSAMRHAAVPTLGVRLRVSNASAAEPIHSILLNCQVRIEPQGRTYSAQEEARLLDLFGERERWARTMKSMHWMHTVLNVPGFTGTTEVELPLPCTLDFDVAATKYFYGLEAGDVPVSILFSGTIFYAAPDGALQVAQIPWDREARFRLPAATWSAAIELHYPDSVWIRLPRETFDRLYRFKGAHGLAAWQQTIDRLLECASSIPVSEAARESQK